MSFKNALYGVDNKTPDFFYQNNLEEDKNAQWSGPGGGPYEFYTTWSYTAIIIIFVFTLITVPALHFVPKLSSSTLISTLLLAIIIGFAANSLAVAVTSQALLDFAWTPLDPKAKVAVSEKWVKKLNRVNLNVHLLPTLLSLIILALVISAPWSGNKKTLMISAFMIVLMFFTTWLCVPIPVSKGSTKKTNPLNKVAVVYNSPPANIQALLPVCLILAILLYVYANRGNKK